MSGFYEDQPQTALRGWHTDEPSSRGHAKVSEVKIESTGSAGQRGNQPVYFSRCIRMFDPSKGKQLELWLSEEDITYLWHVFEQIRKDSFTRKTWKAAFEKMKKERGVG